MRTGFTTLPLHSGRAPLWLFENGKSIEFLTKVLRRAKIVRMGKIVAFSTDLVPLTVRTEKT